MIDTRDHSAGRGSSAGAGQRPSVVLLLNDERLRSLCGALLRHSGFKVVEAESSAGVPNLVASVNAVAVVNDLTDEPARGLAARLETSAVRIIVINSRHVVDALSSTLLAELPSLKADSRPRALLALAHDVDETGMQECLTAAGFEVMRAGDADETFRLIQQAMPQLLTVEWDLPDRGAERLVKRVRGDARFKDTKILALTDAKSSGVVDDVFDLGCDEILHLPASARELVERARRLIDVHKDASVQSERLRATSIEVRKRAQQLSAKANSLISKSELLRQRQMHAEEEARLIQEFLEATASMPAQIVGRSVGVDGQTIQNLRAGRIHTVRRSTREKLQTYLERRHRGIPR
jgi:DNA-binding response OmpR family regulator